MSKIDVIIPCYEHGDYLTECVTSVLSQSVQDLRILIIDDASSDATPEIAARLARADDRVNWRRHPTNRGAIATFNEGLEWASADYTLIISGDDWLLPDSLLRATALLDAHPDVGFAYGLYLVARDAEPAPQASPPCKAPPLEPEWTIMTGPEFVRLNRDGNPAGALTVVVRTALQKSLGFYRVELPYLHDMEMWIRFASHGRVGRVNAYQGVYRVHTGNMSHGIWDDIVLDLRQQKAAIDLALDRADNPMKDLADIRRDLYEGIAQRAVWYAEAHFNRVDPKRFDEVMEFVVMIRTEAARAAELAHKDVQFSALRDEFGHLTERFAEFTTRHEDLHRAKSPALQTDKGWNCGRDETRRCADAMVPDQTADHAMATLLVEPDERSPGLGARNADLVGEAKRQIIQVAYPDARIVTLKAENQGLKAENQDLKTRICDMLTSYKAAIATHDFVRFISNRRVLFGLLRRPARDRLKAIQSYTATTNGGYDVPNGTLHLLLQRRTLFGLVRRSNSARIKALARLFDETSCSAPVVMDQNTAVNPDTLPPVNSEEQATHSFIEDAVARIQDSGLFDPAFYQRESGFSGQLIDCIRHYCLGGEELGLSPSSSFDPTYYAARYPDVAESSVNRLLHYVLYGRIEKRQPLPPVIPVKAGGQINATRENVFLVVHDASRTGAPIVGWNIGRHLANRYNVFTLILGGGPLVDDFSLVSVELYGPLDREHHHPVDLDHSLGHVLDNHVFKYAIINSVESRPAIDACARRLIPIILLAHEFTSYVYPLDTMQRAFDMASEIVFPAETVARSALELHPPLRRRPIRVMPQGKCILPGKATTVSGSSNQVTAPVLVRKERAFTVLGAGTVEFRKGVDLFLTTAMAVRREKENRSVHFVWIGNGYRPDEEKGYSIYLREQLERCGLHDCVTLLDPVADMDPIFALADVFFLSSRLDPMPNVCIDAACHGIPIVCFRGASGMADLLASDLDARLGVVDYLDPVAAGNAILSLAGNHDVWTRVSAVTQNIAQSAFDMVKYVDAIDALGAATCT